VGLGWALSGAGKERQKAKGKNQKAKVSGGEPPQNADARLPPFAFCLLPFAFCLLPFAFCLQALLYM
jgi:hypothetical protein